MDSIFIPKNLLFCNIELILGSWPWLTWLWTDSNIIFYTNTAFPARKWCWTKQLLCLCQSFFFEGGVNVIGKHGNSRNHGAVVRSLIDDICDFSKAGVKCCYMDSCFIVVLGFYAKGTGTFHSWRHWNSSSNRQHTSFVKATSANLLLVWSDVFSLKIRTHGE